MIIPNLGSIDPTPARGEPSTESHVIQDTNILTADIAIVGDPVDTYEALERAPFKGAGYKQFYRLCNAINYPRHRMYLTNCIKTKTQRGQYAKIATAKGYRCSDWGTMQLRLINELKEFPGKIIIASGYMAMTMLLDDNSKSSIDKYRGSCFKTNNIPHLAQHLPDKIICCTYSMYDCSPRVSPINFYTLIADMNKFIKLSEDPSLMDVEPIMHINPTFDEIIDFLHDISCDYNITETGIDIEATPQYITCIGLTKSPLEGMCIPFMNNKGNIWSPAQEAEIWDAISGIMYDKQIKKIAQNGMFDFMYMLRTLGIKVRNFSFDTMIAQHICWTDLPKGLDFLVSMYSYFPYYKDDGKQSHLKAVKDWDLYWKYNCRDAIYTHFIKKELQEQIDLFNAQSDFEYMMDLHAPLMEMEWNGILTEPVGIEKERVKLNRQIRALQHGINKLAGKELNINSPKQMTSFFYGELGIKPYLNRQSGRPTCDVVAMSRIARKKVKGSHIAKLVMKMRTLNKLVGTYFNVDVDKDNKLRCTHKVCGTTSGRIATATTYFGTGCLLPTAEVLTPDGWVMLKDFQEGTKAMQWNADTEELSWCIPKKHVAKSPGMMMAMQSEQTFNCLTPDHRVVSKVRKSAPYQTHSAFNTSQMSERLVPLSGYYNGKVSVPETLLRLMVMIQADGSIEANNIRISFSKQRKIKRFYELTKDSGLHYEENKARPGYKRFTFDVASSELIINLFDEGKTFQPWLYELSLEDKEIIIDELKHWDAHVRGNSFIYYTTNKTNAEYISTLVHMINKSCTMRIDTDNNNGYGQGNNKDIYCINIKPRNAARINKHHWSCAEYQGDVYCLITPTTYFLTRNNGMVQVTGNTNLQNQTKRFKVFLRSEPGNILIEFDLARAEAHCVAYLCQDANMMEAFESKVDVHRFNASKIFGVPMEAVTSAQRQMGKKVVHASNYNMGPQTFSDNLAKEEIYLSKGECAKLLAAYQNRFPGLKRWHRDIDSDVTATRMLYNMFGRPKRFLGMLNSATFRNAYSYIPQSTVAELLNRGLISMYADPFFQDANYSYDFLATVHDSGVIQVPIRNVDYLPEVLCRIKQHMSHEFTHKGRSFTIGLDAKLGTYWGKGMIEIPDFMEDTVFTACNALNFLEG